MLLSVPIAPGIRARRIKPGKFLIFNNEAKLQFKAGRYKIPQRAVIPERLPQLKHKKAVLALKTSIV